MVLGWPHLFQPAVFIGLLFLALGLTGLHLVGVFRQDLGRQRPAASAVVGGPRWRLISGVLLGLAVAAACYVALLGALGPEVQFDARWNHLAVPVHYVDHEGFFPVVAVTRMGVTALTPYQEMLYTPLVAMAGP